MTAFSSLKSERILVTGHTGFTGSWLTLWLLELGCEVSGLSLMPATEPALFDAIGVESRLANHVIGDIRDFHTVRSAFDAAQPTVIFHLAAQPLVRRSYADPLETFSTNIMGTANCLEAAREIAGMKAFVSVTTDKVYENQELGRPFVETDRLGGKDPYSASKAGAELVTRCYQETMAALGNNMSIAAARGGNIIGGGDWSEDRIVPDFYRAASSGQALRIRQPEAVRPWQHVLSACHGYLSIASRLLTHPQAANESWNIGPSNAARVTVRNLIGMLAETSPPAVVEYEVSHLKEANTLLLDTSKASEVLGFLPPWSTRETVERTASWYNEYYVDPASILAKTLAQLHEYRRLIGDLG